MRKWSTRAIGLACSATALLVACGGGASGTNALSPFPQGSQTVEPSGTRIDVSALNIFPFAGGDSITYDRFSGGVANGTVIRVVTVAPNTTHFFMVTETDSTVTAPAVSTYVVSSSGTQEDVQLQDPLGLNASAPGVASMLSVLEEYEAPLFPVGGARSVQAQGDLGADADGDGKSDSFQFQYTQVFQGFESIAILGATRQLAHFTNTVSFTLRYTSGRADLTVSSTEDTYFAPGVGLVRRDSGAVLQNGAAVQAAYSIQARSATVGGITYP
jgi:hypothetical protein